MLYIRKIIKFILPRKFILHMRILLLRLKVAAIKRKDRIIFLGGAARHGNLGDQAILSAQRRFLGDNFPDCAVVEIPLYVYTDNLHKLKNIVKRNVVCISGGGSLGTLWPEAENEIREIISVFNINPVFVLPQTIHYEDSEYGRSELEKSKRIYGANKGLVLCAREQTSFEFMKKEYTANSVLLYPDMVTYLKKDDLNKKRSGILLCMRSDGEAVINEEFKDSLYEAAKEYSGSVTYTDTVIDMMVSPKQRESRLNEKFSEFSSAQLLITDRLHGMLFAAITGTPCIAINNVSKKVEGVYQWIKQQNHYIRFAEDTSEIRRHIGELINTGGCSYENSALIACFNDLAEKIHAALYSSTCKGSQHM